MLTISHLVKQLYGTLFDNNDVEAGENANPYLSAWNNTPGKCESQKIVP